ncbi:DUF1707 domain-containing protein [Dietzia aerolata]|uniref:DUF1707 domain-containing protein n=1 Tax=Dietzia aerolata TaxID=595984 RepID=A0ABV5JSV5_9ACTN|nr:DUF1707 domain-containing protein [Dietzia aerolata]MBB0967954.1 DUF1707 domain-containing protein [Dietzia aerolata]
MSATHSGAPDIRATDENRAAVTGALDKALASGQLDQFEHFERVRAAAQARWVHELRPLLTDLQGVDVELPGDRRRKKGLARSSSSSSSSSTSSTTDEDTRTTLGTRLLLAVPVVAIVVVGVALAWPDSDDTPATSSPSAIEQIEDVVDRATDSIEARVIDNPSPLTLEGLQQMFATAPEASGSEFATRMTAHPEHGGMEWADPEHPSRSWTSSYRGGWDEPDDRASSRDESFRLADLDAEMIAAVIAGAPATLGIPDGTPSHIIIEADASGMPAYSVYASNDVHQSGYLVVNHAGEPVRVHGAN